MDYDHSDCRSVEIMAAVSSQVQVHMACGGELAGAIISTLVQSELFYTFSHEIKINMPNSIRESD